MNNILINWKTSLVGIVIIFYVVYAVIMEQEIDDKVVATLTAVAVLLAKDGKSRSIGGDNVPPGDEEEPPGRSKN